MARKRKFRRKALPRGFIKEKDVIWCDGNEGDHDPHWAEWGWLDGRPVYECDPDWPL